jgi:hypothetical protein
VLDKADLIARVKDDLLPAWRAECQKLDLIDRWYRWSPDDITLPRSATREHKALRELARVPWLGLVVTSTAQCMFVDGYRSELDPADDEAKLSGPWKTWTANRWNVRQNAVHRAMLAYGYSYATALPGVDFQNNPMPVLRGVSPRKMWAVYEDPAEDDWPVLAMRVMHDNETRCVVKVFDDEFVYTLTEAKGLNGTQEPYTVSEPQEHGAGVCPVVRYTNQLDLDGRTPGEIEPHIPIASRINKTSYDRMLVQHFNSWKIKVIAGLSEPDSEEAANRRKLKLAQDDVIVFEDIDTKMWTLDETQLQGFIAAHEADVETLAAVTQTPTHELTGKLINVSAEGLAMIRASQQQKVYERQQSAGASHAQLLRLASLIDGDLEHADDLTGRVTWQDTSIRSLAQSVDALGKAAQMLNIPATELWGRIPGIEKSDVQEWKAVAREQDPINQMAAQLDRHAASLPLTPPDVVP